MIVQEVLEIISHQKKAVREAKSKKINKHRLIKGSISLTSFFSVWILLALMVCVCMCVVVYLQEV